MKSISKHKLQMIIIFAVGFIAVTVITLLIFLAGKKTYNVSFDLNGGTFISGDLSQNVTQGQNATPPTVEKEGCYLLRWEGSYLRVTHDSVVIAIWEYKTTPGILYKEFDTYNEISGSYEHMSGNVYVGSYYDGRPVFAVQAAAFANRSEIENLFFLDGIIDFKDYAFFGCTNLKSIVIPSTLRYLGEGAFEDCSSLTELSLPVGITEIKGSTFKNNALLTTLNHESNFTAIGDSAFENCAALTEAPISKDTTSIGSNAFKNCTSLTEITLPISVKTVGENAFKGCTDLVIKVPFAESRTPEGFSKNWYGDATVEYAPLFIVGPAIKDPTIIGPIKPPILDDEIIKDIDDSIVEKESFKSLLFRKEEALA